jgi:hypothetical protein
VDAGDAVADHQHSAGFVDFDFLAKGFDLGLDDAADFEVVAPLTEQVVFWLPSIPPKAPCVAAGDDEIASAAWPRKTLLALQWRT